MNQNFGTLLQCIRHLLLQHVNTGMGLTAVGDGSPQE